MTSADGNCHAVAGRERARFIATKTATTTATSRLSTPQRISPTPASCRAWPVGLQLPPSRPSGPSNEPFRVAASTATMAVAVAAAMLRPHRARHPAARWATIQGRQKSTAGSTLSAHSLATVTDSRATEAILNRTTASSMGSLVGIAYGCWLNQRVPPTSAAMPRAAQQTTANRKRGEPDRRTQSTAAQAIGANQTGCRIVPPSTPKSVPITSHAKA